MRDVTWSGLVANAAAQASGGTPDGRVWTPSDVAARARHAAAWLAGLDLPPGRPTPALLTGTGPGLALAAAGASIRRPIAPLGPRLTVPELAGIVRPLGGPALIVEASSAALGAEVAREAGVRLVVLPDPLPAAVPEPADEPGPDDVAFVLHTSGTTGAPKPIAYRQGALAARVRAYTAIVPLGPGDVFVSASGIHHVAGLGNVAVATAAGASVVSFPAFSVEAWRALAPLGVTHTLLVPSMIEMLLAAGALGLPGLRSVGYGSSPIHPDTLRAALVALPGVRMVNLFGQTEGSPICYLSAQDHAEALAGRTELLSSIGRPAPGVELRIAEPGPDGVGELWAKGAHLFAASEDGWLRTGDLGRSDAAGYIYLAGRTGDTINRGGENVRPLEVETVLRTHPGVADAAVAGIPDRRLGEEVAAWVVPVDEANRPAEADLTAYARGRLAGFKVPRHWTFVGALPRNAAGKVLRRELSPAHQTTLEDKT